MVNPLFVSTSTNDATDFITISFKNDPSASLGAQLTARDMNEVSDQFVPGYATIGRLLDGDTVAKQQGVRVGDVIVGVNGEGYRRFTVDSENPEDSDLSEEEKLLKNRVITGSGQNGECYNQVLNKIKDVKSKAADDSYLILHLERYDWDHPVNAWERFLVARDNDVPSAMMMQQAHEAWRETTFPVDLTNDHLQAILKSKAVSEIDIGDLSVHPPCVYVNFKQLQEMESTISDSVVNAFILMTEVILKKSPDPRRPKAAQFIDLADVSISSGFRVDILKQIYAAFEPNYPETLQKMVMYPVSRVTAKTTKLLLSFVNRKTREKFVITDDLDVVCKEMGWPKTEIDAAGDINQFISKHVRSAQSLILDV